MSCPPHPHTLPASSPPLARPSFRVLIDRVSFVRPASSSILSLNHPATTTLHTRTPPFACTLRFPSPVCIFYPTHFGSAILPSPPPPHPVGVRLLPPKPEPAPRHLSSSVTSSPCPHLSRARPRCYALPCSRSLSSSFSLVTTSVRWCAWLGEESFYSFGSVLCLVCLAGEGGEVPSLRPGAFSPFLGFLLPPLTLHPAYLTKSSTAVSQGAYR